MEKMDAGLLDAMLVDATEDAPIMDDPSLASDQDLEAAGMRALETANSSEPFPVTHNDSPSCRRTKTATERCHRTCGGCRG